MALYNISLQWSGLLDFDYNSSVSDVNISDPLSSKPYGTKAEQTVEFMTNTRAKGAGTLTVWIVNNILDKRGNNNIYTAFSIFPSMKKQQHDGIVIRLDALGSEKILGGFTGNGCGRPDSVSGGTLVHEFGHWMGLLHDFHLYESCPLDDLLSKTWSFRNTEVWYESAGRMGASVQCCMQDRCGDPGNGTVRAQNWMSYSPCRGTKDDGMTLRPDSFTASQKARMFAHFTYFRLRRTCNGQRQANKRDIANPDVRDIKRANVLADLLARNCSLAIQDVYNTKSIPLSKDVLANYSAAAVKQLENVSPKAERPPTVLFGHTDDWKIQ
ncbi:hypothetical protein EJ08DRAFT_293723 [Tothia fuscella]|uniref:Peptidase M43 pregnancy-associated plasma-A domain-containing protein n=1 Tax=Tothia fuscella TaxID=1048955 RepID=A0A9P4U2L0_9PEZI|nr:hypothetical protein EJ08DRAFT_293723 [Tothia fuscella]